MIVWFHSPPSVCSLRTLISPSPIAACSFWFRFTVTVRVPRASRVVSVTAPATGFSSTVSFVTSLVQSSFLRTCRRTITPPPALAFFPVVATLPCFTPRCCSSLRSSNTVAAVPYSATSCFTVSRFSITQLHSPVSSSRVTPCRLYRTPLDPDGTAGRLATFQ